MSKWLKVFILLLLSAGCVWMTVYLHQSDADYRQRGVVVPIDAEVGFSQDRHGLLAHMSYRNQRGEQVPFKRFVSTELAGRLRARQPVSVEYIPGEWNSERFAGEDNGAGVWALLSLGLITALVLVIRKPAPARDCGHAQGEALDPARWVLAWIIRGGILVMAIGGLMAGVAGIVGGGGGTGSVVMLGVGIAFAALFAWSLTLRLA